MIRYYDTGGSGFYEVAYEGRTYFVRGESVEVRFERPGTFAKVTGSRKIPPGGPIATKIKAMVAKFKEEKA